MRTRSRLRSAGRLLALATVMALFLSLAVVPAQAATAPTMGIVLSRTLLPTSQPFTISGNLNKIHAGKTVSIEVRKPGRTYWSVIAKPVAGKTGNWSWVYKPKLGGKFYFRARFNKELSRTASLTCLKGPGYRYQITFASTTSTRDSGLFERLGPAFLAACPEYTLKATFVGSGAAIALGGTGDADVLLAHSPAAELDFMKGIVAGAPSAYSGKIRHSVMYNDYVLVGPVSNPAGVVGNSTAQAAFQAVATAGSNFWSRNDKSGTNTKEKDIWAALGNPQAGASWYKASGTMGMAQALAAANDAATAGYTLSDRATWLNGSALGITKNLAIVNSGDAAYFNQYSVIEVKGARNWDGAMDFDDWIRSPQAQALIKTYGEYTYPGQIMFEPNAGKY